jgi:hypothetical protein
MNMDTQPHKGKILLNWPHSSSCDLCDRDVSELEPFDQEICEALEERTKLFAKRHPNSLVVTQNITDDHKLAKTFREIDGCVGSSWECRDCYDLSNDEAIEMIVKRQQASKVKNPPGDEKSK